MSRSCSCPLKSLVDFSSPSLCSSVECLFVRLVDVERVSSVRSGPQMWLNCPRPPAELQAETSKKFPERVGNIRSKDGGARNPALAHFERNFPSLLLFSLGGSQSLTVGFFLGGGVRKGAMFSPSSSAGLASQFWISFSPACRFTNFDSSAWMAF